MNSLSAVIVTHNNQRTITACIEALHSHNIANITVVDNASTDTTREELAKLPVTVITNTNNLGFASAANQGAKAITSDLILFINPDAILKSSVASVVHDVFTHQSTVG